MMNKKFLAALFVTSTVMFGACCSQKAASENAATAKTNTQAADSKVITNKKWKLVELNGKTIETEAFITLQSTENRINGNAGCNDFSGIFELKAEVYRIKFSKLISTQKMCFQGMETENAFLKVLEMTDNYSLTEDSKGLSFNRLRMTPLARFELVK